MKKKQKILIIIVTVIFLVSVVTVNAAAFDHDLSIEEIPGYTTDHLDAIYGDDYVILRLGTFTELGYGYDQDYISMWDGCPLERLNQFIYEAEEEFELAFVAPQTVIEVNRRQEHGEKSGKPLFVTMLEREARVMELLMREGFIK